MKAKRHTPEQVIAKLAEGDRMLNEGKTATEVACHFGITETTCSARSFRAAIPTTPRIRTRSVDGPPSNAGSTITAATIGQLLC